MPALRLVPHEVLLLQQLQPVPAPLLLPRPAAATGPRAAPPQRPVGGGCRKNKRASSARQEARTLSGRQFNVQAPVPTDLQLSSLFTGSCDFGGSLGFPMDYSMMPYEAQEDVKPGSRMLSLEWPEQAGYCLDSSYGFGIWAAGMIGPSSAAM
ncbi:uncharacterized protein A4U43_C06F6280 [Asparagus officinalis]|uniref:Dof-type domain-containing protein n=1 Tax=Asparagus officinalis TaxID=4686 RepID=A0A5P1EP21_ASPOF|nr:uncharacterized protein A4U43_C06F6280 [Asparagus officinalis]